MDFNVGSNFKNHIIIVNFLDNTMNATGSNHLLVHLKRFAEIRNFFLLLILRANHKEIHNSEHSYQHNPHHASVRACSRSLQEKYSHQIHKYSVLIFIIQQRYQFFDNFPSFFNSLTIPSKVPLTKLPLLAVLYTLAISTYSFNETLTGMFGKLNISANAHCMITTSIKATIASPLRFSPFSRKLKSGENKGQLRCFVLYKNKKNLFQNSIANKHKM